MNFGTSFKTIYLKFYVDNLFIFDTGVSSIFGHMTCPTNFKRTKYRQVH